MAVLADAPGCERRAQAHGLGHLRPTVPVELQAGPQRAYRHPDQGPAGEARFDVAAADRTVGAGKPLLLERSVIVSDVVGVGGSLDLFAASLRPGDVEVVDVGDIGKIERLSVFVQCSGVAHGRDQRTDPQVMEVVAAIEQAGDERNGRRQPQRAHGVPQTQVHHPVDGLGGWLESRRLFREPDLSVVKLHGAFGPRAERCVGQVLGAGGDGLFGARDAGAILGAEARDV